MNEVEWKSSLKEHPRANKTVIAWTKVTGMASAKRSKEGKWTLSNHDGQTWYTDDESVWWCEIKPPFTK